jgi:hypothetical protein
MNDFNKIWQTYVVPLKGKKVYTISTHAENTITDVTGVYLERISSKKNVSKIPIDVLRSCYSHICKHGMITRTEIHRLYAEKFRASSIIFAILARIPVLDIAITRR